MSMPWLSSLNTGERGFDEDHRHLFELLGEIRASLGAGNLSGVRALFAELRAGTEQHYREEEAAMARHGYPAAAAHRVGHDRGRAALALMDAQLSGGRLDRFVEALADYTAGYFQGVLRDDLPLAAFLRERAPFPCAPQCAPAGVQIGISPR